METRHSNGSAIITTTLSAMKKNYIGYADISAKIPVHCSITAMMTKRNFQTTAGIGNNASEMICATITRCTPRARG